MKVTIANGATSISEQTIPECKWSCDDHQFSSEFMLLDLGMHDGIIGLDWLATHSPMQVDWQQKWMAFQYQGKRVTLQGTAPEEFALTVLSICIDLPEEESQHLPEEIKQVLEKYSEVFAAPKQLPPRRHCDHRIPLIPGACPVAKRPYRIPPHLKDELEKQIAEMLQSGVIRPSSSPFSSPILMVRKKDGTWRMVVDYRHLNALTLKSKYPLPIIDELLDELSGAA